MGLFHLPEVQSGVPQAKIVEIIFCRCIYITLSLDVIAKRLLNQKGILQVVNVFLYCILGYSTALDASECICKFSWI